MEVCVITKYFFTLFCTYAGLELRTKQHNRNILLASGTVVHVCTLEAEAGDYKMETYLGYTVRSCQKKKKVNGGREKRKAFIGALRFLS